jgi:hypothetical protein
MQLFGNVELRSEPARVDYEANQFGFIGRCVAREKVGPQGRIQEHSQLSLLEAVPRLRLDVHSCSIRPKLCSRYVHVV